LFRDFPFVHKNNTGRYIVGKPHPVGNDNHSHPFFGNLPDNVRDFIYLFGIKRAGRFIKENHLGVKRQGVDREEALDKARSLLSHAGIGEAIWEMYPATFSGGEKQWLNILHAIITRPRLLLLEEPAASLDKGYKNRIMEMILGLKAECTAMVGVFHDRDALLALADRRYDLVRGAYCDPAERGTAGC
jgi:ABC-type glutathione transport system ATPase component